jgi:hypothetical protein
VAVPAWEVDRLVTVVPPDPIMLGPALAGHHLDDLTLPSALADVGALHDDPVTRVCVHGEPPYSEVCLSSKPRPPAGTNPRARGHRQPLTCRHADLTTGHGRHGWPIDPDVVRM